VNALYQVKARQQGVLTVPKNKFRVAYVDYSVYQSEQRLGYYVVVSF
jgi:putative heme iron utilization protein